MTRLELIEAKLALVDLNGAFCHFLDLGKIEDLVQIFTEDVVYSHGDRVSCGRDELRNLFTRRLAAGPRTSRHLQTALRLTIQDTERAFGTSFCLTFAAEGPPPIVPAMPFLVADFHDEYLRDIDGIWRICNRHIERIFVAADNVGPVGLS